MAAARAVDVLFPRSVLALDGRLGIRVTGALERPQNGGVARDPLKRLEAGGIHRLGLPGAGGRGGGRLIGAAFMLYQLKHLSAK
ncbi:hypothetical protein [Streptomyces sp. NBC_00691]|uniref:hypothetical protein n=1 Tax=Streptomyces sp. NBC_00691 TaxID=2903671 RepID=UPI002E337690|nr:hypothetical protein [Streptomyces sp. NBC_00691]